MRGLTSIRKGTSQPKHEQKLEDDFDALARHKQRLRKELEFAKTMAHHLYEEDSDKGDLEGQHAPKGSQEAQDIPAVAGKEDEDGHREEKRRAFPNQPSWRLKRKREASLSGEPPIWQPSRSVEHAFMDGNVSIESKILQAERGDADAQYLLGCMVLSASRGAESLGDSAHLFVNESDRISKCMKWLVSAAEKGHTRSRLMLGQAILQRLGGGTMKHFNKSQAFSWCEELADRGDAKASYLLARLHLAVRFTNRHTRSTYFIGGSEMGTASAFSFESSHMILMLRLLLCVYRLFRT